MNKLILYSFLIYFIPYFIPEYIQQMTEKHVIKISVQIKMVKLLVRFPCKLTFQLKTDSSQSESRSSYELKKGQCQVNEIVQAQMETTFDSISGQYEDKKVRLIIQMASTNGVIPAGSVSFSPCNKEYLQRVEYNLPLEKCPDRSAQITFLQSFQLLRKNMAQMIYQSQLADRKGSKVGRTDFKYSSSSNIVNIQPRKSSRDVSNKGKNTRLTPTNAQIRDISPSQRYKTTVVSQVQGYGYRQQANDQYEQQYEFGQGEVAQEDPVIYNKSAHRYVEPNDKAQYIRQIAKLKGELKNLQSQDRWDQLIRIKEENQSLGNQLEKARQRVRGLERREREIGLQLKEAKEDSERNKSKYLQSQSVKNQSEVNLADRQRSVKELQGEVKRYQEKIQDLNVQLSNQQKRVEFKENSYQQQLRKINQKYTLSENERQKITFDYNALLAKLEQAEKKNQTNTKQKDRAYTQEKNKLTKKIDQMSQSLQKLKEEFSEKQIQLNELTTLFKISQKKDIERDEKLNSTESELELNKILLKKQQDQRKVYEKQILEYKVIEEERNGLRKKNNEQISEISKLQQRVERLSSDLVNSENKGRQLETTLAERNRQKDNLNNKLNTLKKELQNLKRQEERHIRQHQTISAQNFNAGQKLNEFKSKLQTQKRDAEQMKAFYEEQLAYLAKGKQYCQNQIEQFKWSVEKGRQQYEQISNRLKQANQQILQLNQTNLVNSQKAKRSDEQNRELHIILETLRKEIVDWQQKERTLNQQIKVKSQLIYQSQKKLQAGDSQIFILKQKLRQIQTAFDERRTNDEKSIKQRQRILGQKGQQITQFQMQVMALKEEKSSLSQQLAIKNNQLAYLNDSMQLLKQEIANRDIKHEQTKQELNVKKVGHQNLIKEHQLLSRLHQEQKKSGLKLKKDWDEYRRDTTKAFEKLIQQIAKDQEIVNFTKHNLLTFPDSTLTAMQAEAIKKRNIVLQKYQTKISQIQEEKFILQTQVNKTKKNLAQREEQLENIIKNERIKSKQQSTQLSKQIQEYVKKIQNIQQNRLQQTGQLQKSVNQIKKREQVIQQLNQTLKVVIQEREQVKNQLKSAQESVLQLKSHEIRWKASNQFKMSEINGQNQSSFQMFKTNIADLEKKISSDQKILKQKQQTIKKLQVKVNELKYQKERSQIKVVELHQKLMTSGQERKELDKRVKLLQKQNKEINSQLHNTKQTLTNQKVKLQEIQGKLAETYSALTQSQVDKEKLKAEIELSKEHIADLEDTLKDKNDKIKSTSQKSSQEIKLLKQKIISLNSAIQLKDFQIGQHESQLSSLKQNFTETKDQLTKKKSENIKFADKIQQYKNQQLYTLQNIEILKSEKQYLQEENDRLKDRINSLEEQLREIQLDVENAQQKQAEYAKSKEELQALKAQKQKMVGQMRNSLSNVRSSGMIASRLNQNDQKKRIRELQQLLQNKHVDLSIERKKMFNDFERQKRGLIMENSQLQQQVSNLQSQFDFQRAQLNKEIDSLNEEIVHLQCEILEANELMRQQEKYLEGVKTEENSDKIKEYLANMKKIFMKGTAQDQNNQEHLEANQVQHVQQ